MNTKNDTCNVKITTFQKQYMCREWNDLKVRGEVICYKCVKK